MFLVLVKMFPGQVSLIKIVFTHDKDVVEVVTHLGYQMLFPLKSDKAMPHDTGISSLINIWILMGGSRLPL